MAVFQLTKLGGSYMEEEMYGFRVGDISVFYNLE
jgi:hypothetical protein